MLLPLFQTPLKTNNPHIINEMLAQKYGIAPAEVYWLDTKTDDNFECVVRLKNLNLSFEGAVEQIERRKVAEETLRRVQADIFNVIKKHE